MAAMCSPRCCCNPTPHKPHPQKIPLLQPHHQLRLLVMPPPPPPPPWFRSLLLLLPTQLHSYPNKKPSHFHPSRWFRSMAVTAPGDYEEMLGCLSSLITTKVRAHSGNRGDRFEVLYDYLKILELEEQIKQMKIIHVAGTKGKGSTCTFTESILRCCGFRTGLFTSPHLMDVRERFRLEGIDISEEKFMKYFWWCWNKLKEKTDDDIPMPTYFRFLALLAFKIFAAEQVDVAVLEVGLGGKFDATNVVEAPVVCGITSLGYDHMEILGNTLGEIAGEKAGIFKKGVPSYTAPQPEEAMSVLKNRASQLGVPLQVAQPLDPGLLRGQQLGLHGEHQYINAGLAVALASTWLEKEGYMESIDSSNTGLLPEQFVRGLTNASLQGRAQIVRDTYVYSENNNLNRGDLVFYLDGAHSPESMDICGRWFSHVIKENAVQSDCSEGPQNARSYKQILLFNCMSVRDPQRLLPHLVDACAQHGVHFHKALFVPNQSQYNKLGSNTSPPAEPEQVDLSWQLSLQTVWEKLLHGDKGLNSSMASDTSSVFESLPLAIKWLRETTQQNPSVSFQVLVTGSLHLVGDVLRLVKK